jgi:hypothetical protein
MVTINHHEHSCGIGKTGNTKESEKEIHGDTISERW